MYCVRCGFRMPTAGQRSTGVSYRKTEQTEPHGGGGQGVLAFAAVLVAGMLFVVGAVAVFLGNRPPAATPTAIAGIETETPGSSLPIFSPEEPSLVPSPTATPTSIVITSPSPALSPALSPDLSPGLSPDLSPGLSPSVDVSINPSFTPISSPTSGPTPTRTPTQRPTPTHTPTQRPPTPTPTATAPPATCANATGGNSESVIIGFGNPQSHGPIGRAWCIVRVIFRPFMETLDTPSTGEPGVTRLLENGVRIAGDTCSAAECNDKTLAFNPAHLTPRGSTLQYEFTCQDNPGTPDVNECTDPLAGGATIEIQYVVLPGS
jgi:hypothetical protein